MHTIVMQPPAWSRSNQTSSAAERQIIAHLDSIRRTPGFEVGPHGVRIARQGTSRVHFGNGQIHFGAASSTHVRQRQARTEEVSGD